MSDEEVPINYRVLQYNSTRVVKYYRYDVVRGVLFVREGTWSADDEKYYEIVRRVIQL